MGEVPQPEVEKYRGNSILFSKEARKRRNEFKTAVRTLSSFVDEKGSIPAFKKDTTGDDWHEVRKYDRKGTHFPWWEDPIAEGAVIEQRPIAQHITEEIPSVPILYVIGEKRANQKHPTLYRYDAASYNPGEETQDNIAQNTRVYRFEDDESENANKLLSVFEPTSATRYEVVVWVKGSTKKEKKTKKKSSSRRVLQPQGDPIPVPVPARN